MNIKIVQKNNGSNNYQSASDDLTLGSGNNNIPYQCFPPNYDSNNSNITTINDKVYINGYEWKNGEWKRTLKALWYKLF